MLPRCGTNLAWRQACGQNPPESAFAPVGTFHPLGIPPYLSTIMIKIRNSSFIFAKTKIYTSSFSDFLI
jgi:hypothetical protein